LTRATEHRISLANVDLWTVLAAAGIAESALDKPRPEQEQVERHHGVARVEYGFREFRRRFVDTGARRRQTGSGGADVYVG
jgi:hypothetical protein